MSNPLDAATLRAAAFAVAQLRHAYQQLRAGTVQDQAEFARGLIGPSIERLEQFVDALVHAEAAAPRPVAEEERCPHCSFSPTSINDVLTVLRAEAEEQS